MYVRGYLQGSENGRVVTIESSRGTSQNSSVYRWKSGVGKMNAIANRLHNSFKIKDNSLTGRNYERNKKYVP